MGSLNCTKSKLLSFDIFRAKTIHIAVRQAAYDILVRCCSSDINVYCLSAREVQWNERASCHGRVRASFSQFHVNFQHTNERGH